MHKSQEEFVIFLHQALHDPKSQAHEELYHFLVNCFVKADDKKEGKVSIDKMDSLVDLSAELPRKFGFAPTNEEIYPNDAARKEARAALFGEISSTGYISLEQWICWATKHIAGKQSKLPKDYLSGNSDDVSKDEFIAFIKKTSDRSSSEFRQLYYFLLNCFKEGDVKRIGAVDLAAFDKMVEAAAKAPRKFGLAPKSSEAFKTDADRIAFRRDLFVSIDKTHTGQITFNEWLDYAYPHIVAKIATL